MPLTNGGGPTGIIMTEKPKESRPDIHAITSGAELKNWYWLKTEIIDHARALGVDRRGGKFEIIDRIATLLDTGVHAKPKTRPATKADFDWHTETLTPQTIITDSYRNTQNVRRFFEAEIGRRFSFNIAFMAWIKANVGRTLQDATNEWLRLEEHKKAGNKPAIPFHNQFNAYVQAFFEDNPNRIMDEARHFWKLKRSLPGHNRYERADLDLKE
jgi:hypothetical protein